MSETDAMSNPGGRPTCFIAMPITTSPDHAERYRGDQDHWHHVMVSLFEKSIEEAGFEPIRPAAQGAHLIHGLIIRHLSTADLVLVDLSSHNPNVFFELGVRTSINKPIALVRDEHTSIPFDTSGINAHTYDSNLNVWQIDQQKAALAQHIKDSYASCDGQNPLWRQFGLTIRASEPDAHESPLEAKVDLLTSRLTRMQSYLERDRLGTHNELRLAEANFDEAHLPPAGLFVEALHHSSLELSTPMISFVEGPEEASVYFRSPEDRISADKEKKRILEVARRYGVDVRVHHSNRAFDEMVEGRIRQADGLTASGRPWRAEHG